MFSFNYVITMRKKKKNYLKVIEVINFLINYFPSSPLIYNVPFSSLQTTHEHHMYINLESRILSEIYSLSLHNNFFNVAEYTFNCT